MKRCHRPLKLVSTRSRTELTSARRGLTCPAIINHLVARVRRMEEEHPGFLRQRLAQPVLVAAIAQVAQHQAALDRQRQG